MFQQHYAHQTVDRPDTGRHPNGMKQSETSYKQNQQDGFSAEWYENGQKKFEMNYKKGVLHGLESAWDEQGQVQYQREYKYGKLVE